MSEDELAWNEQGVARSTHAEWPTKSYTMNAASPDKSPYSDNPLRASSWPRTKAPPGDMTSPTPTMTRPTSLMHRNSSRSSRTEERRPVPVHRDSLESPRAGSRAPSRNKFFKDYQDCKMHTLDAEQAEDHYSQSIRPASKLSKKELKERQANSSVYGGVPLATREFHQKAAELAEVAADAFHDAIKSHRRMVEHYKNRGDNEKLDWHKSIIEKFGSKENLMNASYSQHITSHTDPSSLRGYVNSRMESNRAAMATRKPPVARSVGFDLPSSRHTTPEMLQRSSARNNPTVVTISTATSLSESEIESEASFDFDSEPEAEKLKPFDTPATEDWVSPRLNNQTSPKTQPTVLLTSPRVSEVQPQVDVQVTSPSLHSQSTPKPPSEAWFAATEVSDPHDQKKSFQVPVAPSPEILTYQDDLGITTPRAQSPRRSSLHQDTGITSPKLDALSSSTLDAIANLRSPRIVSPIELEQLNEGIELGSPRSKMHYSPRRVHDAKVLSPGIETIHSPRIEQEAQIASPRTRTHPSPRFHDLKVSSPVFQPLTSPRTSLYSDISSPRLQPRPARRPRRQTEPTGLRPHLPLESDFPSPRIAAPPQISPQPHHVEFGSPRVFSPELFTDDESMTSRQSRTLTRQGSIKRSTSPKARQSFYDEWDKVKLQRGVKKIGDTGRASMGRQVAQTVLPWGLLLVTLVI